MASLESYLDQQLAQGRAYFTKEEARRRLGLSPSAFAAAALRLAKKRKLINARHEFYLILRPEDWSLGAPDPVRWIDPLMQHQRTDYRVSLLRAAAFHGASHQAAMVFQIVVPKQLRLLEIGRHRLQFLYQAPGIFEQVNRPEWLDKIKTAEGFTKVAGVELTLLDCVRYFHQASGIAGVAQIVKDIGGKAAPRKLAKIAGFYENSAVRRLGYLLDLAGHSRQSAALEPFAAQAKSFKPLDPAIRPIQETAANSAERNTKWRLTIHEPVEVDF
ncbi:type IV toxin-antitoxin system AbiEi family antitoxin domain-containing protein [Pseudacidobacterium ailaaui]|uniref:type IV toxin-antitoxin system AbiEi family antitoxin domain-containing protein n=1 Tax=Pseudacidobacterium ailaaui TaxID=1382359 RepID=UPI00138E07D3|nr:type IV toxin-antitoxin system AbiEi family antitoxin [Pseudacidobacterium ailaaui]